MFLPTTPNHSMVERQLSRRRALSLASAGALASLSGCSTLLGEDNSEEDAESLPKPKIVDVTTEVQNFRQTRDYSTTYILLENNGSLGELKLTIKAKGQAAIYDDGEQVFSLKPDQQLQTRFELFTHEGADEIEIRVEATVNPDEYHDTYTVTEDDPDDIDYSQNE